MNEQFHHISIGKVIRDGLAFNPQNWGRKDINADTIPKAVIELLALLDERKIDYVLVGGIALLSYVKGRNTSDLDLILAIASLEKIPEIEVNEQEMYFARGEYQGLQLDFLFTDHPIFKMVSEKFAGIRNFQEKSIRTATVEGLLLLKLFALPSLYRQGDFSRVGIYENDIAILIQEYSPQEEPLLQLLTDFLAPNDLAEVRNILKEIHGRLNRFNSTKK
jgi:hypothetical protein